MYQFGPHYIGGGATLGTYTWDALPPANAVSGMQAIVTDLGRALFYSDGARWRPTGGRLVLHNFYAEAGVLYPAGAVETVVGAPVRIPGGLVRPGDSLRLQAIYTHPAIDSAARGLRYRLADSAAGALAGAEVIAVMENNNANTQKVVDKHADVLGAALVRRAQNTAMDAIATSTPQAAVAVPPLTGDTWLALTVQPSAGTSILLYSARLVLEVGS